MNFSTFMSSTIRLVLITSALILPGITSTSASPQSAPHIAVNASLAPTHVKRGRSAQIAVVMDIPSGYHVNSSRPLEKFLIPTQLKVEAPDGIRVGPVSYPRAVLRKFKFSKSNVSVYEGSARMRVTLTVPGGASVGSKEVKLRLRYQSCNDEVCFPPQTKELSVWLNVQ